MSSPQPPDLPPPHSQNPFRDQPPYPQYTPGSYAPLPDISEDPAMRWVLPVGQSMWSIISGYLGLLSIALCFLGPFAVLTGVLAIVELRKNPRQSGWGRAIIGIVLGTLGSIGLVIMIIALASGA